MLIDTHIHPALFAPICADKQKLQFRCDEMNYHKMGPSDMSLLKKQYELAGITKVFLLPEDCSYEKGQAAISNDEIAELVALDPEFYVGFATVDPRKEGAAEELAEAFEAKKLSGLKLNTAKLHIYPDDERIKKLLDVCRKYHKPVIFHAGLCLETGAFMKYARPCLFEELVEAYPDVNMCLAHFGWPWHVETTAMLIKYPNLYANTALMNMDGPRLLFKKVFKEDMGEYWLEHNLADKVMFGSDSPRIRPVRSKVGLDNLGLRADVYEKIAYKNALRFLGQEE